MSWQAGLILVVILATVVPWALAELFGRVDRRWIRRLQQIERGRAAQRASQ